MITAEQLATIISKQGGEIDALVVALGALCETLRPDSELAGLINGRLEQWISSRLHDSLNEDYLQGFEQVRSHFAERLERMPPNDA